MRLRRLWRTLLGDRRFRVGLFAWPILVLIALLLERALLSEEFDALRVVEAALLASALAALAALGLLGFAFYRKMREIRNSLFQGDCEGALSAARTGITFDIHFDRALGRLLEFDRRRAERVAASSRLLSRLLREAPLPILIGDLDDNLLRFSHAFCEPLALDVDRFSLLSILLLPANQHFARVWNQLVSGERTDAEARVDLHLPARKVARNLALHLFAVQDDAGRIAYVIGFGQPPPPAEPPAPEPEPTDQETTGQQPETD